VLKLRVDRAGLNATNRLWMIGAEAPKLFREENMKTATNSKGIVDISINIDVVENLSQEYCKKDIGKVKTVGEFVHGRYQNMDEVRREKYRQAIDSRVAQIVAQEAAKAEMAKTQSAAA
jgi:hypothetical protein